MRSAETHLAGARERGKWDPPSMFRDISDGGDQAAIAECIDEFGSAGRA